jgi:hypothetical protein
MSYALAQGIHIEMAIHESADNKRPPIPVPRVATSIRWSESPCIGGVRPLAGCQSFHVSAGEGLECVGKVVPQEKLRRRYLPTQMLYRRSLFPEGAAPDPRSSLRSRQLNVGSGMSDDIGSRGSLDTHKSKSGKPSPVFCSCDFAAIHNEVEGQDLHRKGSSAQLNTASDRHWPSCIVEDLPNST